jgi:chromosome segregation ATPase
MFTDERIGAIEHGIASIAVLIVLACTMGGPLLNWGPTREQLAQTCVGNKRVITQLESSLQTAEGRAKAQSSELVKASNSITVLQARVNALQKERDDATGQTSNEASRVKELQDQLEAAKAENTKLNDTVHLDDTKKKLDEALERATKAEDRIRELTLQLHNAGIWP